MEEDPPAEAPEPEANDGETPDSAAGDAPTYAESGPAADDTAGEDAPAGGELARAIDAMNAVPPRTGVRG